MIILIDFENTHASGFQGVEYLDERDTLVVYYSDENSAISKGLVEDLKEKNVHVRMVKLLKQHSNALDMYIASTTGMFLDTGEKICIVSKDRGYAAVRDFWHSLRGAEILLGETIEECFLNSVANDDERIRRAKDRSQKALLTESFETMNKIPTRPTLSRSNYWRRKKQANYDLSKHLVPVEILPNPLAKPEQENGYAIAETELLDLVEEIREELALEMQVEEDKPAGSEESAASFSYPIEALREEPKIEEDLEKKVESLQETESAPLQEEKRSEQKQERKDLKNKANQVRFVYDPVKKAMIKVEEAAPQTAMEESKETVSSVDSMENREEHAESLQNSHEKPHEEHKKRNNRRRGGTNRKKETGAQPVESEEKGSKKEEVQTEFVEKPRDKEKQDESAEKDRVKKGKLTAATKIGNKEKTSASPKKDAEKEKKSKAEKKDDTKDKTAGSKKPVEKEKQTKVLGQDTKEEKKILSSETSEQKEEKSDVSKEGNEKRSRRRSNAQKNKKKDSASDSHGEKSTETVKKEEE